ncbi:lipopolysaccharide biosynthesis protein [Novosphingobium sp. BW1]|uniref:lipopolysaccharide biosynthesis protein n=1 Tax=Novosphingobium sp. BW1 TaxID=2592621 RepID=UPI0011DED622|nr:lipopolysaccharide biosynthesis protein [Novosphingobium sp. BW1]TYC85088.1 lipopolysaccharide biosynthesis protein [Novosphingobium sp. BW1]
MSLNANGSEPVTGKGPEDGLAKTKAKAKASLTERTIHGIMWQFLGTFSESGARIVVLIVLVRLLTPVEFGVVMAAQIVVGFTRIVSQLGMGPALVQRYELEHRHLTSSFAFSFYTSLIVVAALFFLAPFIAAAFQIPELVGVIRVLSIYLPFANLGIVSESMLLRDLQFKWLGRTEFLSFAIGYAAVGIGLAWLGFGVWSLVGALIAQAVMRTGQLWFRYFPPVSFRMELRSLRDLMHFSLGQSMSNLASYVALQIDNTVVGVVMGPVPLGLYGRAYQFLTVPSTLFGKVSDRVLFPAMSSIQHDAERLWKAFESALGVIAMITIPTSGLLVLLAPEFVSVVLGANWDDMTLPFQLLCVALCFRTGYKICDSLTRARGSVYNRAFRLCIYAVAVFVGAYVGTRWGLVGVAAGVSLAITLNYVMMIQLSMSVVSGSWRGIVFLHLRHIFNLVPILAPAVVAVLFMRAHGVHPVLILMAGGLLTGASGVLLFLTTERPFGAEGRWIKEKLLGKVFKKFAKRPARS